MARKSKEQKPRHVACMGICGETGGEIDIERNSEGHCVRAVCSKCGQIYPIEDSAYADYLGKKAREEGRKK